MRHTDDYKRAHDQQLANQLNQSNQVGLGQIAKNEALREIAGRLKRLSYRDMQTFCNTLNVRLPVMTSDMAVVVLNAADELEKA